MYNSILKAALILISLSAFALPSSLHSMEIRVSFGSMTRHETQQLRSLYGGSVYEQRYDGKTLVVVRFEIEDYLIGVLRGELDELWPEEALKAQAVLARTYAMVKVLESREKKIPYDIENSILNQVYRSTTSEKLKKAVNATAGEILTYEEEIARVFYHAACGGSTTSPGNVWGGSYPYLEGVSCGYCRNTPYYEWEKRFTKSRLSDILDLPPIDSIRVASRDNSGRATSLQIILKNGRIVTETGNSFRMKINSSLESVYFNHPETLPSALFYITNSKDCIIFQGTGYGHGVGLCQWGARKMADKGLNYREIIKHYFHSLEIRKLY